MESPPLTPLHTRTSSQGDGSVSHRSYQGHYRRRTSSSFSSNHDRSPTTPRLQHRFSNGSAYSGRLGSLEDELDTGSARGGGLGNLADELDQLDDDEEYDDFMNDDDNTNGNEGAAHQEATRDSGIDVSYEDDTTKKQQRRSKDPPDDDDDDKEDWFSPTMDDVLNDVSRMVKQSDLQADPAVSRFRAVLLDLESLASMEVGVQRLNTSTNSMAAYFTKEARSLQMLSISLFSPFGLRDVWDFQALEESLDLIDELVRGLPQPDSTFLHGLEKLSRETDIVIKTNMSLVDTAQDCKQPLDQAARHLRRAREEVAGFLQAQEQAEIARFELSKRDAEISSTSNQTAAAQCKDIVDGFDEFCEGIRQSWTKAVEAAA